MNILYIEKNMSKASPLITHGKEIIKLGAKTSYVDFSQLSTVDLITYFIKADVIILQHYGTLGDYEKRQLAFAALLGTPLIRNWAGSDSLNVITREEVKKDALQINKFISNNITNSHKGLIEELSSVNISCDSLPKLFNITPKPNIPKLITSKTVLVYLPTERRNFYGAKLIKSLIERFPEVTFSIIGDDEHFFSQFENVISHGWVSHKDMENIWNNIGMLIRITDHDGTPRMIYEALSRGKYVIHNNKHLEAIWYASSQNEVEHQLKRYLILKEINKEGIEFINSFTKEKPALAYLHYLSQARVSLKTWLASVKFIYQSLFS